MAMIPFGFPVSLSVWKNSKNENPSPLAIADDGNNSPRYLAFWVARPGSKVRRTGSSTMGSTPASSQQASKSLGVSLFVTKLPLIYIAWQPAFFRSSAAALTPSASSRLHGLAPNLARNSLQDAQWIPGGRSPFSPDCGITTQLYHCVTPLSTNCTAVARAMQMRRGTPASVRNPDTPILKV